MLLNIELAFRIQQTKTETEKTSFNFKELWQLQLRGGVRKKNQTKKEKKLQARKDGNRTDPFKTNRKTNLITYFCLLFLSIYYYFISFISNT